jgi:hypothetical protein
LNSLESFLDLILPSPLGALESEIHFSFGKVARHISVRPASSAFVSLSSGQLLACVGQRLDLSAQSFVLFCKPTLQLQVFG